MPQKKTIVKLYLLVKVDGATVTVRQVHEADDGTFGFGEAVDLAANKKAQLTNVAKSLQQKLEG